MDQAIVESQNRSRNRKVPASETGQSCNLDYFAKAEIPAGSNPCGFFTDDYKVTEVKRWLLQATRAGRARLIDGEKIQEQTKIILELNKHTSNDIHILALSRASGARIVFTGDGPLCDDLKNGDIIKDPRGRIYKGVRQKGLLTRTACSK